MHQGVTIWLTGLPCSGKSTIANHLQWRLHNEGRSVEVLDGDVVRTNLSRGLTYSREDRETNLRRIGFVCHLLSRNGVVAIAAAISPFKNVRDELRGQIPDFVEVWISASLEECIRRDVKGMYKKAMAGDLKHFTGVDDPYEEPENPDLVCNTERETVEQSVDKIMAYLRSKYLGMWHRTDTAVLDQC